MHIWWTRTHTHCWHKAGLGTVSPFKNNRWYFKVKILCKHPGSLRSVYIWPKVYGHPIITPISGSSRNCCYKAWTHNGHSQKSGRKLVLGLSWIISYNRLLVKISKYSSYLIFSKWWSRRWCRRFTESQSKSGL